MSTGDSYGVQCVVRCHGECGRRITYLAHSAYLFQDKDIHYRLALKNDWTNVRSSIATAYVVVG